MDSEKKWGCIGYALLALITWGLTQGFKVVCIIIGILIAILIAFIFISNLSTKRLIKKFKHQKHTLSFEKNYEYSSLKTILQNKI